MRYNICICGNIKKLKRNCINSYCKTCGNQECITKLRCLTMFERYGVEHALQSNTIRNDMINKLLAKDNVTNVSKLTSVKDKKICTCFKNFGVEHPMQSNIVMDKSRETLLKIYGVNNISKLNTTIKKIQETKNKINPLTGKSIISESYEKRILYYNKIHNVDFYFQTDEFKDKYKIIMINKYGEDNYFKTKSFRDDMLKRGIFKNNDDIKDFKLYSKLVRKETKKVVKKFYNILYESYEINNDLKYHIDHIYSIYSGYKNNVPINVVSSIINLQLLPSNINSKKNRDSWITIEELYYRYNNLKIN